MAPPSTIAVAPQSTMTGKVAIASASSGASPASASSPTSSIAPTSQIPQLAIKPVANGPGPYSPASTPSATLLPQMPKTSITSKEWVIPPRPKPGRKPATDTPPTKRKAQNRAAQRAFRERRAARVGELEEQIEDIREEHEQIQQELQDEIQALQSRCSTLEALLEKERAERTRTTNDLDAMRRRWMDERAASVASSRTGSLPGLSGRSYDLFPTTSSHHHTPRSSIASNHSGHRNSTTSFSISQIISPPDEDAPAAQSTEDTGCGSCGPDGSCACVEEALAATAPSLDCGKCSMGTKCECLEAMMNGPSSAEQELKRKHSISSNHGHEGKRQRSDVNENEIDFTAMFSKKRTSVVAPPPAEEFHPPPQQLTIPPRDSCGFCTEGTYCMCAEAASAAAQSTLAPIGSQVQTPPASEDDVVSPPLEVTSTGAIKLPRLQSLNRPPVPKKSGCGPNGPGTCAQCVADPKSGLFCRSLAAKLNKDSGSGSLPSGCCGGAAGGGGCCKTAPSSSANAGPSSAPGLSLSCADAYKTLSSHRNFDRAADDIGTWLPQLKAVPHEVKDRLPEGRSRHHPLEVEAASIMSVLKGFDVRFGREP
ncbi:hypothetical protein PG984_003069 [Apiospora sp. TS-2023a]